MSSLIPGVAPLAAFPGWIKPARAGIDRDLEPLFPDKDMDGSNGVENAIAWLRPALNLFLGIKSQCF